MVLPRGCRFLDNLKARQVRGLAWRDLRHDGDAEIQLPFKWYVFESLAVLAHVLFVVAVPLLIFVHTMFHQHMWATLLCPSDGMDGGRGPLMWTHVTGGHILQSGAGSAGVFGDVYLVPFARAIFIELAVFIGASLLMMIVSYAAARSRLLRPLQWIYSLIVIVHLFVCFTYAGVIGSWLILAAALEPVRFLPFGVAVLVVLVVGTTVSRQMIAAAERFKGALRRAFNVLLQQRLRDALKEMSKRIQASQAHLASEEGVDAKQGAPAAGAIQEEEEEEEEPRWRHGVELGSQKTSSLALEGSRGSDPILAQRQAEAEQAALNRPVDPSELFALLDTEGDGELSIYEFRKLFKLLELPLTDAQHEQLFAFCDIDCSGTVSEREFHEGFDRVVELFLEHAADGQGVSRLQIALLVGTLLTMLTLLMVFVLVTIFGWQNDSSFTAIIQSSLMSGMGKAVTALRQRGGAEDMEGKSVDDLVSRIVQDQANSVDEAGDASDAAADAAVDAVESAVATDAVAIDAVAVDASSISA